MYHVANDLRAKQSAARICAGVGESLRRKPITDLTVTEIVKRSGVGRATFYRLFDNVDDVLMYQCDALFEETIQNLQTGEHSPEEYVKCYICQCMNHEVMIRAIIDSGRIDILFQSHQKYCQALKNTLMASSTLTPKQTEYTLAMLTSAIASVFLIWKNGEDTVDSIYQDCAVSIRYLGELLNPAQHKR